MQQQEKLKQKMHDEQQQQLLQQNPIVPLTPESVARFLASQNQSQILENQPWSMHHSTSAPSFLPFTEHSYPTSSSSPVAFMIFFLALTRNIFMLPFLALEST